jgi:cyclopropane fatty-acyl-phospholipid synthase-like methyltransferase
MVATKVEAANIERFSDRYRVCCSPARQGVEATVLGADYGSTGYTTRAQADLIAGHLRLRAGDRLADIGAGNGWPGLYFANRIGCTVIGTDLPFDGMAHARERAAAEGLDGTAAYVVATGRHQPLRPQAFDAAVHTDVLCCLGPKLAVLRACRRLLRPGGRMAFTTIYVPDDLDPRQHRRGVRAGPWQVATRRPYRELVAQAGFTDITEIDVTDDYARTQKAWFDASEAHADVLRRVTSETDFAVAQRNRRLASAAIAEGLLRRSLFVAVAGRR